MVMKKKKILARLLLAIVIVFIMTNLGVGKGIESVHAMSLSDYEAKVNAFINDSRWANGIAWGNNQKPKIAWNGIGCCSYVNDFARYVFNADNQRSGTQYYGVSNIQSGDVLYVNKVNGGEHWIAVLSRNGNNLYVAEGNASDKVRISNSEWKIDGDYLTNSWSKSTYTLAYGFHYETIISELAFPLVDGQFYYIYNRNAGRVLDMENNTEGARIILNDKMPGNTNQMWKAVKHADGYSLISCSTGYAMDVYGYSTENYAEIKQYAYHGNTNQRFQLVDRGDGYYSIHPVCSGLGLDAYNADTVPGTKIIQYGYHGGLNMQWSFEAVDNTAPHISNVYISDIDSNGYTIYFDVTDDTRVDKVWFNTWTVVNGGDDFVDTWDENTTAYPISGNTYAYRVNASDHNNENGVYHTTLISWDSIHNMSHLNVEVTFRGNGNEYYPFASVNTSNVTNTNAQINVDLAETRNATKVGFYISKNSNMSSSTRIVQTINTSVKTMCYDLNQWYGTLEKGTTYYYQPYVIIDGVYCIADVHSFTTSNDNSVPTISNVRVEKVTNTSCWVKCEVTDNVGVSKVSFPTWTENNGQDDLAKEWPTVLQPLTGNTYGFEVKKSDHNNEDGKYITHIYAYDEAGNQAFAAIEYEIKEKLETPQFTVANVNGGVQIKWDFVDNATGYIVYRREAGGTFSKIAGFTDGKTKSYTDKNVVNGKAYFYAVKAINSTTQSTYTTKGINYKAALVAPTFTVANVSGGVQINWNFVDNATGYIVYRREAGGTFSKIAGFTDGKTKSYTDNNVVDGKAYFYAVKAINGTSQSKYMTKGITYKASLVAPTFTIENVVGGVQIKWNFVDNAIGYIIYRREPNGVFQKIAGFTDGKTKSYIDKTVVDGNAYFYAVKAVNNTSQSKYTTKGINYEAMLVAPQFTVTNIAGGVQIDWNFVDGAVGYIIYRREPNGTFQKIAGFTDGVTKSYVDKNVVDGNAYFYAVKAVNNSSQSTYTTKGINYKAMLATPTFTVAKVTNGVQVNWNFVDGATGYIIYRREENGTFSKVAGFTDGVTKSYVDTTAVKGTTYYYAVKAINSTTQSTYNSVQIIP